MRAETVSMSMVRAVCQQTESGQHWFSRGAMRFFLTKLPRTAKQVGMVAYFISSEQFEFQGRYDARKYSIRCADLATGRVETIGEFQAYATRDAAKAALKTILEDTSKAQGSK